MPTTTVSPEPRVRRRLRRAFSLVELMIATGLSGIVMTGVFSAALMISRSGYLLNNYTEMEGQARVALETFAVDARTAMRLSWNRASDTAPLTELVLTAPDNSTVTYTYDTGDGSLVRATSAGDKKVMVSGIQSFTFSAYSYDHVAGVELLVPASKTLNVLNNETKMVQISLSARRTRSTLADATNTVVSARFVLRNKSITV